MKVAYPGREGAHSAAACAQLFPEAEAEAVPSFADVVEAVSSGRVEAGVLPIESSVVGPVTETHDLLVNSPLSINAQTIIPIRHFLVGVAQVALTEIRIVRSHPVALDQCRQLLASLPEATAIAAGTTADAAAQVADRRRPDRGCNRERASLRRCTGWSSSRQMSATIRRLTPASSPSPPGRN